MLHIGSSMFAKVPLKGFPEYIVFKFIIEGNADYGCPHALLKPQWIHSPRDSSGRGLKGPIFQKARGFLKCKSIGKICSIPVSCPYKLFARDNFCCQMIFAKRSFPNSLDQDQT